MDEVNNISTPGGNCQIKLVTDLTYGLHYQNCIIIVFTSFWYISIVVKSKALLFFYMLQSCSNAVAFTKAFRWSLFLGRHQECVLTPWECVLLKVLAREEGWVSTQEN